MDIKYAPNPLRTSIALDDIEYELLRARLEIEDLEERIVGAHVHLGEGTPQGLAKAIDDTSLDFMDGQSKQRRGERLDLLARHCRDELLGEHCGDCTCVPMSCMKCYAEQIMRVDTLGRIGKHEMAAVAEAFKHEGVETTADAIARLEASPPVADQDWKTAHIERWNSERLRAIEYLKAYNAEHFQPNRHPAR